MDEVRLKNIERSIIKKFRGALWARFVEAIDDYKLIQEGDKVAVCISGGKDSFLMAKLFQELQKHWLVKFDCIFLVMDPGYKEENRQRIIENAKILDIPIEIFETSIFNIVEKETMSPCYLCARMRRGYLYREAKLRGCNKIALGHHFNDVIETTMMSIIFGSQVQTMLPKIESDNVAGMELIRPMYKIREKDIISWARYNDLEFLNCACKFTEDVNVKKENESMRKEIKVLIEDLKKKYPNTDINIFKSMENVNLNMVLGYKKGNDKYYYLDEYNKKKDIR
ncbi:MAG: tRNA 2-thiocytidine biosynthesis protein TtcA [Bacilli bacterium]|nr:tRNA 2-thiocytidine biosynthesis protein TtcA [Bacilli bacterium]